MGTFFIILCFTAVLTLPWQCNAMETATGVDYNTADGDVYLQLLRRVEDLEIRDHQQHAVIDTLRGELKAEKQRTTVLEGKLERLMKALAEQHGQTEAKQTLDEVNVRTGEQRTYQFGEPAPFRNHRFAKSSGDHASRVQRHLNMPVVAFHATLTKDAVHTGVNQGIAFDRIVTNIGAAYNPHVGSFVAPVAGVYVFHTTVMIENHDTTHFSIVRNGVPVAFFYGRGAESVYDSAGGMVVVHLNKGDDVMVQNIDADKAFNGDHYTMFSGFLLYQDNEGETIVG